MESETVMLYFCLEVNGYDQLARVKPQIAEEILSKIETGLSPVAMSRLAGQGDLFLFGSASDSEDSRTMETIRILISVRDHLEGMRKHLQGFTLLVDRIEQQPVEAFQQMKSSLFLTILDGSLYAGVGVWPFIRGFVRAEEEGALRRIIEETASEEPPAKARCERIQRTRVVERICEILGPLINGEEPASLVLLTGPPGAGKRYSLDASLRRIGASGPECSWLRLYSTTPEPSWLHPLLNSISNAFLEMVPTFLTREERALWEESKNLLTFLCTDHLSEDFFSVYHLYVSAYINWMKQALLPCFMICEDVGSYHPETIRFLQRIWKEFVPRAGLIPIVVGGEDDVPPTLGLQAVRLRIERPDRDELREILVQRLPAEAVTEELVSRVSGLPLSSVIQYMDLVSSGEAPLPPADEGEILAAAIQRLSSQQRRTLFIFASAEGLLSRDEIIAFLSRQGMAVEKEVVDELERSALLRIRDYPTVINRGIGPLLEAQLGGEGRRILESLRNHVYSLWKEGRYPRPKLLLSFLWRTGDVSRTNALFYALLSRALDEGKSDYAVTSILEMKLIKPPPNASDTPGPGEIDEYMGRSLLVRAYMVRGDFASAGKHCLAEEETADLGREWAGEIELESARFFRAAGKEKLALERTKRVLLHAQGTDNRRLLSSATIEIGLIMLNSEKCEDAMEYFIIARDAAERAGVPFELIRALTYEALSLFIFGNLSNALRQIDAALAVIERAARREWQMFLLFLKGRVFFELGFYDQAVAVFQSALSLCDIYAHRERKKLFYAWMARAQIYGANGEPLRVLKNLVKDSEVLFFMSEAYLLAGDTVRALSLLESAMNTRIIGNRFHPGETIPWENGFAPIEDRAIRTPDRKSFLYHLLRAFRGYLLGCSGNWNVGMEELSRITREDKVSENDPNNHLYYLFSSLILPPGSDTENIDKLTILSKALKYIQQRASRIDEVVDKQAYLGRNLWNLRLMSEARKNKLI